MMDRFTWPELPLHMPRVTDGVSCTHSRSSLKPATVTHIAIQLYFLLLKNINISNIYIYDSHMSETVQ